MLALPGILFLCSLAIHSDARSVRHHVDTKTILSSNFIGEATNELATSMLQLSLEESGNYVFSPIGYSTILAILAEGARGNTRQELASALHFPEDTAAVRQSYKNLLTRMKFDPSEKNQSRPEFKNWFYVYKNYSVEDAYKKVLSENYLTDVKAVEFDYYAISTNEGDLLGVDKKKEKEPAKVPEKATTEKVEEQKEEKKPVVQETTTTEKSEKETEKKSEGVMNPTPIEDLNIDTATKVKDDTAHPSTQAPTEAPTTEKEVKVVAPMQEDNAVQAAEVVPAPQKTEEDKQKTQEDKMKVQEEKQKVQEDKKKMPEEKKEEVEKKEPGSDKKEPESNKKKPESNNKVSEGDKKEGGPLEGRGLHGSRHYINKDTVTSLTANRLSTARAHGQEEEVSKKIIIFNGFYYQGNWSVQFSREENGTQENYFYVSESEKKPAKMMHAVGEFESGFVPELDATAIELPYQGNKYSLLVLLPKERNGLRKLASALETFSLPKVDHYLVKKQMEVCLPRANFYTISKPKPALVKSGVKELFEKGADLSALNNDKELYLDELVQLVTMHFEETNTATNFLTSSLVLTRSNTEQFVANHPFFFFLRDRIDGIILAAGKLQDPTRAAE